MALQLRFNSNGELAVARVQQLGVRIADPSVVLEDFAQHMLNTSIPANFEGEGRPAKWERSAWSAERQQRESGRLLRSIQKRVSPGKMELGTTLKYARQRQFGGVLKPVKAKALAVPVPGLSRAARRPQRWGDRLHFIPAETKGNTIGVLAVREGRKRDPKWVAKFILKKSVNQPARPFLLFQDDDLAYVNRRMVEYAVTGALR